MIDYSALAKTVQRRTNTVQAGAEFRRISELPTRTLDPSITEELSARLRAPGSTATLLPAQALSLLDAWQNKGLFAPLPVGSGKTLITFLLPWFLGAKRPLLIVPAALAKKTDVERARYAQQWQLPNNLRVISYEKMARESMAKELESYQPDAVILDEAHRAKNPQAAVTRRLRRYRAAHPTTRFAALSGTITKRSLKDFAHIIAWCLPFGCPVPQHHAELEAWADALDVRLSEREPLHPGPLLRWCLPEDRLDGTVQDHARRGFRRRLVSTPGVVALAEQSVSCSLVVSAEYLDSPATAAWEMLRRDWELPNGEELIDGPSVWRAARQIGLGFYYRWKVQPPKEWRERRKEWARAVRWVLQHSRAGLDTEAQVAGECVRGTLPADVLSAYAAWTAIRETFRPETITEWLSDHAVEHCYHWLTRHHGILWVGPTAFGAALEDRGWDYYGAEGLNSRGQTIEMAPAGRGIVASIAANGTGRNLQHFSQNYLTSPPKSGMTVEQLVGRTHRMGQSADEVSVRTLFACREDVEALAQARIDAAYQQNLTGQTSKLLICDWTVEEEDRKGHQWQ